MDHLLSILAGPTLFCCEKQTRRHLLLGRINTKTLLCGQFLYHFLATTSFIYIYVFTHPLHTSRMWHKVNLLNRVEQIWIQSFTSPRLVAIPMLNSPICPTSWMHTFPNGRVSHSGVMVSKLVSQIYYYGITSSILAGFLILAILYHILLEVNGLGKYLPFPMVLSTKWNTNNFVQDLKSGSPCPFPTTITITQTPPYSVHINWKHSGVEPAYTWMEKYMCSRRFRWTNWLKFKAFLVSWLRLSNHSQVLKLTSTSYFVIQTSFLPRSLNTTFNFHL